MVSVSGIVRWIAAAGLVFVGGACPPGSDEFQGHCYTVVYQPASFLDAQQNCGDNFDGNLVTINSQKEQYFLWQLLKGISFNESIPYYDENFWLGYYEATWWMDGSNSTFSNWAKAEPRMETDFCAEMCVSCLQGWWANIPCDSERYYVCEAPAATVECACPEGYTRHDKLCLRAVADERNFQTAGQSCGDAAPQLLSGRLAVADTREKSAFFAEFAREAGLSDPWIGLYSGDGDYHWVGGEALDPAQAQWAPGEPSVAHGGCAHLDLEAGTGGLWATAGGTCLAQRGFLCQARVDYARPGCPPGYSQLGTECYAVAAEERPFQEARAACQADGFDLVTVPNPAVQQFLSALAFASAKRHPGLALDYWVGLEADPATGVFGWVDGSEDAYRNWMTGNPVTPEAPGLQCAAFTLGGGGEEDGDACAGEWANHDCAAPLRYACGGPQAPQPLCPPGYVFGNGNCWGLSPEETDEPSAEQACAAAGDALAKIEGAEDQTLMETVIATYNAAHCAQCGVFTNGWIAADQGGYSHWAADRGNGSCLAVEVDLDVTTGAANAGWVRSGCAARRPAVCKAAPAVEPVCPIETLAPTAAPTLAPTHWPTVAPGTPTRVPTASPTAAPTLAPTQAPTLEPTLSPTRAPTAAPTRGPTKVPTDAPTPAPTQVPTDAPTGAPTLAPTTAAPTQTPTHWPTVLPGTPTRVPTEAPTLVPTIAPTKAPTLEPTASPTELPTTSPTLVPTATPTRSPSKAPTQAPTKAPTDAPTEVPTLVPTTAAPTQTPTHWPTVLPGTPTRVPTEAPTRVPTITPTESLTLEPEKDYSMELSYSYELSYSNDYSMEFSYSYELSYPFSYPNGVEYSMELSSSYELSYPFSYSNEVEQSRESMVPTRSPTEMPLETPTPVPQIVPTPAQDKGSGGESLPPTLVRTAAPGVPCDAAAGYKAYAGLCLKVAEGPASRAGAAAACAAEGAALAVIKDEGANTDVSMAVLEFLLALEGEGRDPAGDHHLRNFWVGLVGGAAVGTSYSFEEEVYRWDGQGAPAAYFNWNPEHVEGFSSQNQDCVAMGATKNNLGTWNDKGCHLEFGYVCELLGAEVPSAAAAAYSYEEEPEPFSYSFSYSYSFGEEAEEGAACGCPPGFAPAGAGLCLHASEDEAAFYDAEYLCQARGAHLLGVHSAAEEAAAMAFLEPYMDAHPSLPDRTLFWFGLLAEGGRYAWTDGGAYALDRFVDKGQAADGCGAIKAGYSRKAAIMNHEGLWNTKHCWAEERYLCAAPARCEGGGGGRQQALGGGASLAAVAEAVGRLNAAAERAAAARVEGELAALAGTAAAGEEPAPATAQRLARLGEGLQELEGSLGVLAAGGSGGAPPPLLGRPAWAAGAGALLAALYAARRAAGRRRRSYMPL